jgi:hypothetical protein
MLCGQWLLLLDAVHIQNAVPIGGTAVLEGMQLELEDIHSSPHSLCCPPPPICTASQVRSLLRERHNLDLRHAPEGLLAAVTPGWHPSLPGSTRASLP